MSLTLHRLGLLAACLVPALGLAEPQLVTHGRFDVRLDYDQDTQTAMDQKSLKFGDPLHLVASFKVPPLPKGVSVELIVSPRDAALTVDSQQGTRYAGKDSGIDPAAILIGLNLSSLQPNTRVNIPLTVRPQGKNGSAVLVSLRALGEGSELGFATRALASDGLGHTRQVTFTQLASEQHQALTKDVSVQRKVLLSDQQLPFDEQQFAEALKTQSPAVELLKGGEQ
ncbi:MAG: hypothetical protein IPJ65_28775 [Archangiaceae bacterium]|nr:hypothetical protein [Archangiaceae bacterium]